MPGLRPGTPPGLRPGQYLFARPTRKVTVRKTSLYKYIDIYIHINIY
jgi:hypothetical protein